MDFTYSYNNINNCIFEYNVLLLHEILISVRLEKLTGVRHEILTSAQSFKLISKHVEAGIMVVV